MPTTPFNATLLRYAPSGWHNGEARQGKYNGSFYQGEIFFNFASKVDVSNINISEIVMSITFGALGGAYDKHLFLRTGNYDGQLVGEYSFSSCYNTTKKKTFNASSNASGFNKLKSHIEGGGTKLGIYTGTSRGGSSSKKFDWDYLSITAMSLDITYTFKKSTGSIGAAETNSPATLAITANSSAYSHVVTWSVGSNSYSQNIAAGVSSASYSIPHSWLPNAESGTAKVELETLDGNGNSMGSNVYEFALTVPSSVVPAIGSLTVSPVNAGASQDAADWGLYIQNKTQAQASMGSVSAGSGSSITAYSLTCSPNYGSASSSSLTTGLLTESGTVTFTAKVTDARGRTATKTATITVQAYAAPQLTSTPSAYRCDGNGDRDDINGKYAMLTASFSYSSVNSQNSLSTKQVALNSVNTNLTSGTPVKIGAGALDTDISYTAVITLTDVVGSTTTYTITIPSARYVLHVRKNGRSIGIFRAAGTTDDDTLHIGGTVALDSPLSVSSGGTGQTSLQAARNAMGLGDTTGALPAANGGTGQTSLQAARNAMGLGDTTGALPVANGGTGAANAADARANLGAAPASYQSGEVDTGGTWIDGKTIYRYVLSGTNSICNTQDVVGTLPSEVDALVSLRGYTVYPSTGTRFPVPYSSHNAAYTVGASITEDPDTGVCNRIRMNYGSGWTGSRDFTLIIEYTKASANAQT